MTHNDILRRVRYILDARDNKIAAIFAKADHQVSTDQVNRWLKKDDDPAYVELTEQELVLFLDGLIVDQRGPKDGPKVEHIPPLTNNLILMKLKIAFNLKSEDVLEMMKLAGFKISQHELTALFRKKDHKHYRVCKNQMLRKFLKGVQIKYRGQKTSSKPKTPKQITTLKGKTLSVKTPPKPSPEVQMQKAAAPKPAVNKTAPAKTTDADTPTKKASAASSVWKKSIEKTQKPKK